MTNKTEFEAEVMTLRLTGLSCGKVAKRLGVTTGVVAGILHRRRGDLEALRLTEVGKAPSRGRGRPAVPDYVRALVLKTANREGVSVAARQWGVSKQSVYNWQAAA